MTKTNKIVTAVVVLLVVVLCGGFLTVFFVHKDKTDVKPAEIQYNATFGEKFEEEHPLSTLSRMDNMSVAPYAYKDTKLFSGKRITKIAAPVGTVTAVDDNQYFTLWVIKSDVVKAGGKIADGTEKTYKVHIPREEITSTSVNKWITIDLSDQFIYVGEDETLAFMKADDPVICKYADGGELSFIYDLSKTGREQTTQSIYYSIWTDEVVNLKGKNISILGDSISTFGGISNDGANANTNIKDNAVFYPKYEIDKAEKTWWKQAVDSTGMNLLVNNSWSGSKVTNGNGAAYDKRATELHDNTGNNKGTNPDIIAVYMGVNDFDNNVKLGSFKELSEVYSKENGYITPESFAQAYAIMLHKITQKYGKADVYVFTLPYNGTNKDTAAMDKYNDTIRSIAKYFKCRVVDIAAIDGYEYEKYTSDGLHPNEQGMDLITDLFVRTLKSVYKK